MAMLDDVFLSHDKLLLTEYYHKRCVLCNIIEGVVLQKISVVMFDKFPDENVSKTLATETGGTDNEALDRDRNITFRKYSDNYFKL